jgi:pyrroloquinoline quinone (PQQ) biosynthesis protein C
VHARGDLYLDGRKQFSDLARGVFGPDRAEAMASVFDVLVPKASSGVAFPSYVTDDHTPFEFSVALGSQRAHASVRLLAEPHPTETTDEVDLASLAAAGRRLATTLEDRFGAHLGRFRAVEDLFLGSPGAPFAAWYAADFGASGAPSFKVYLNPQVAGVAHAPRLVEEALERLGMREAWAQVRAAARRGPEADELRFVSLDLSDSPTARVKVYLFQRDATFADVDHAAGHARFHDSARLAVFLRTIAGGDGHLVAERDVGTCLSFVGEPSARTSTVHVPIRAFAGDDEVARARIELAATELGLDSTPYRAGLEALGTRHLREGSGLHSYASLRSDEDGPRLNLYLSPELRGIAAARPPSRPSANPRPSADTPMSVVLRYEQERPITVHPFLQKLVRKPVSVPALTLLLSNFRIAITRDFARRLAQIVARVDEDSLRTVLAKQLNDELGDGDPTRAHRLLFERFVEALQGHLPAGFSDAMLAPGRALGVFLEAIYTTADPYEGLGASLIMEVFGKQVDSFIGDEFRRGAATTGMSIPPAALEWLTLHETLEVEHVDESIALARAVPEGATAAAAARGAAALGRAAWVFFDSLDDLGVA